MAQRQLPALCRRLLPGVRRCRGRDAWSPGGQWAWHSDGVGGDRCGIYLRRPKIAVALPAALPKLELANRIDRRPARPWRLTDGGMAAGAIRRTRRMQHRGAAPTDFAGSQRPSRRRWTLPPPRQYARVKPPSCRMLDNRPRSRHGAGLLVLAFSPHSKDKGFSPTRLTPLRAWYQACASIGRITGNTPSSSSPNTVLTRPVRPKNLPEKSRAVVSLPKCTRISSTSSPLSPTDVSISTR